MMECAEIMHYTWGSNTQNIALKLKPQKILHEEHYKHIQFIYHRREGVRCLLANPE